MEKIYNKLVRDNIPEIIKADGGAPQIRILELEEYLKALLKKLEEEAKEVAEAGADQQALMKEIGDVYEIIDAIIDNCGLDKAAIKKLQDERRIERGGFKKRIFLESVNG